jgi:cytochrome c553
MEAGITRRAAKVCLRVALMGMALPVQGGDARAASCVACHGADGIGPNLAGQQKGYLIREMQYFRDGVRGDAMITPMAKTLSNEDVENVAGYYSGLCACKEAPIPTADGDSETEEP